MVHFWQRSYLPRIVTWVQWLLLFSSCCFCQHACTFMSAGKCKLMPSFKKITWMEHKNQPFKCHLNTCHFNMKIYTTASRDLKWQISLIFLLPDKYFIRNTSSQRIKSFTTSNFLLFQLFRWQKYIFWHIKLLYLIFRSTPSTLKSKEECCQEARALSG